MCLYSLLIKRVCYLNIYFINKSKMKTMDPISESFTNGLQLTKMDVKAVKLDILLHIFLVDAVGWNTLC